MRWENGFTASYYAYIIDPKTWREIELLQITDGSISHSNSGLRDSADITCIRYNDREQYIRLYLDVEQAGSSYHVPLFTGLTSAPTKDIDGVLESDTIECYSVLKPAEDVLLQRGYYVPTEISADLVIKQLLSVTPAPLEILGETPAMQSSIIAEDGENHLSMVEKILTAINWRMRILGNGTIQILPPAQDATRAFDPLDADVIEPTLTITRDWYACPNVLRAISGELTAEARDESDDSPLSVQNRGREIWAEETNVSLNTGESISEYAIRRLKELQLVETKASYTRRYDPDVLVSDLVRLNYPKQGLQGLYEVTSQKITLGYGCTTEEEVKYVSQ